MDSLDLLAREDEFKKLNKQLEKKTESLMKEIEHVMQKQDFFSEFSHSLSLTPNSTPKRHQCHPPPPERTINPIKPAIVKRRTIKSPKHITVDETKNVSVEIKEEVRRVVCDCCLNNKKEKRDDSSEFLQAFVSVGVQERVFPQSFLKDNISVESICKFLSSKVKLMQDQIDNLQDAIDKKAIQCKAHLTQVAELEGERMSLLNKNNNLRSSAADAKAKCMGMENRLAEKDRLYKAQRSECDKLSREVQKLRSDTSAAAARHAAQNDALGRTTQQLEALKMEHQAFRDSTRSLAASHQSAISSLESKLKCLKSDIDKKNALIDTLRKHNALLSTEAALRALEKDYSNFLNQDL
ncbi:testis-expressed protein 9-like [Ostrinia furnacalis]|uniref:testis-expressed protein 9-like n=1 Tax=Ostrinia furnacalis TaxID=93504 RepID=UPI001038A169|nr:testis-expressed protein 9-like [Ostrinia furnacalis]